MGAFEKLQGYSASTRKATAPDQSALVSDMFDVTTPQGYFLNRVHQEGYKIVETVYTNSDGVVLTEAEFNKLSSAEKSRITKTLRKTELANMITSPSDTLTVSCAGSGKALVNGTGVATIDGFTPIEELDVGSQVYGVDGELYSVVGVFPQGVRDDIYTVEFDDGSVIKCTGDHLWTVEDESAICVTKDTKSLRDDLNGGIKYSIRSCKAVYGDAFAPLTLPPYIVGVLTSRSVKMTDNGEISFTDLNDKIVKYVKDTLAEVGIELHRKHLGLNGVDFYYFVRSNGNFRYSEVTPEDLLRDIVFAGRIPDEYLISSIEDRLKLLSGVIDSSSDTVNHCYFTQLKSRGILLSVRQLVESLGLICRDTSIDGHKTFISVTYPLHCLRIYPSAEFVHLHNLRDDMISFAAQQRLKRGIVSIKRVDEEVECTCIQIDSADHLYLTEHYIPTHNTTALIFKIMHDIITGEATKLVSIPNGQQVRVIDSVFVGTFLRSGADELRTRLDAWQRKMGYMPTADKVNFGTLHAEFKRALNELGVATPLAKESDLKKFVRQAADGLGITKDGRPLNNEDYMVISSIIAYYRNRLDSLRYDHPSCDEYDITPTVMDNLVNSYNMYKQMEGLMDFEDLQDLLYKYLYVTPNPSVQNFIANRYSYIYLDEFQDTSQIQYAILKFYARGRLSINKNAQRPQEDIGLYTGTPSRGKIIAIGDEDQCIYGWRGSDIDIICNEFKNDFSPAISQLSVNYRCPESILTPAASSIGANKMRVPKILKASRTGGEFRAYEFTNIKGMLKQLLDDISKDYQEGKSVAILCRTNFDGMIPAFLLEMERKYDFSISSSLMTLSSPLPKKIVDVASLFTERSSNAVRSALKLFVSRYAQRQVDELIQTLRNDETKGIKNSIWTLDERDIQHSCPELYDFVVMVKQLMVDSTGRRTQKQEVEALKGVYCWLISDVFTQDTPYEESARAYIETLLYLLSSKNFASVSDFVDAVNTYNDRLLGRVRKKGVKIEIVTVHEFKGKERDSIVVWNDSEGVFPSIKTDLTNQRQLEEERRVHYIACTRARHRCRLYAIKDKVGMFAKEMGVTFVNPIPIQGVLQTVNNITDAISKKENEIKEALQGVTFNDKIPD